MSLPTITSEPEDRSLFARHFDTTPFQFRHTLQHHPAFQLDALLQAAERMSANPKTAKRSHFESGMREPDGWFGNPTPGSSLVDSLAAIQSGSRFVILKRIHDDPMYRDVLDDLIPQISAAAGIDIARRYYDPTMTVFVTSPGRITPYHIDGETNFLAQIHGTKSVYIYDGRDHTVLSPAMLENYWTGNLPKIERPENLPHGHWQYTLAPGNGVFNPVIFPHWLQNGDDVSISVSINIKRRHNAVIGAHATNHFMRRAGLKPKPAGQSASLDRVKELAFGQLYRSAKGAAKNLSVHLGR